MKCWCGNDAIWTTDGVARCQDSDFHDPVATGEPAEISRLYVAGPMSGYADNNYPAFNKVAGELRVLGYDVVNPAEFSPNGQRVSYVDLIREDLKQLLDCHGVATLDGWWNSTGARNEVMVAGTLRMPVLPWFDWSQK